MAIAPRIALEIWGKDEILGASPIFILPPLVNPLVARINLYVFHSGTPQVLQLVSPQSGVVKIWPANKIIVSGAPKQYDENPLVPILEAPGIIQTDGIHFLQSTFLYKTTPWVSTATAHLTYYPYASNDSQIPPETFIHLSLANELYPAIVSKTKSPYLMSLFLQSCLSGSV